MTHDPGDFLNSALTFVAGNGGVAKKFKKQKCQTRVVKNMDVSLTENPCFIVDGLMAGEKRKLVDNMVVDGGVDFADCGSKKLKMIYGSESGSTNDIVEAEVGLNQPRREL